MNTPTPEKKISRFTPPPSKKPTPGLHKKSLLQKMVQVSGSTLISRMLGIVREILSVRFLGAGVISDAFLTAYKVPNSLRKIFAEGALSAAFIPTLVNVVRTNNRQTANNLMSLAFLLFEGIVLTLCGLAMWHAQWLITHIAPGFSPEQVAVAIPLLRILMPFIFFISSSALLAGALQSVNHFFIPAISPVLLNLFYISGLIICMTFSLPVTFLCYTILLGGLVQLLAHVVTYWRLGFSFGTIDMATLQVFGNTCTKFLLCAISMSIVEINLFIDTSFASYLPNGSISLIYYANRFMGIPLGIFAVAFSTILLPHFSRVVTFAPKRLNYYLFESAKLIVFVTVPVAIGMGLFSEKIFSTIFLSKKFTAVQVLAASKILRAFLVGLFFFSFNKILFNLYHAIGKTWVPALIAAITTGANVLLNSYTIKYWGAPGLAAATTISSIIQMFLCLSILDRYFNYHLYPKQFLRFLGRYLLILVPCTTLFYAAYTSLKQLLTLLPSELHHFLINKIGFWLWIGPLSLIFFLSLLYARKRIGIRLHFID